MSLLQKPASRRDVSPFLAGLRISASESLVPPLLAWKGGASSSLIQWDQKEKLTFLLPYSDDLFRS